ncbi:MAG: hypothetical protein PHV59_11315 [Victivallales bacterium]|nr:hypothetical protein [Victivallales bacterium]
MRTKQELEKSKEEEIVFFKNLIELLRENKDKFNYEICGFMAMEGHLYNRKLMVVGKAPNGGYSCLNPSRDITNDENDKIASFYRDTIHDSVKNGEPMRWVVQMWGGGNPNYNTKKSAFWRVIHQVTGNLKIADIEKDDWSSYLVWSNLFKLAPKHSGNPSETLKKLQKNICIELLSYELSVYKPQKLLFLTGENNWFDSEFKRCLKERVTFQLPAEFKYIQETGTATHPSGEKFKYAVSPHPQCKPEDRICEEITACFTQEFPGIIS